MIGVLLLGAGTGTGLWLLTVWVAPPTRRLGTVLARLTTTNTQASSFDTAEEEAETSWGTRAGRRLVPVLRSWGLPRTTVRKDLLVLGRSADTHLAQQASLAILGLLAPPLASLALTVAGMPVGLELPMVVAVGLAAVGFLLPDMQVRRDAARRRGDFRHALSAYLDLVMVSLAGGAGIDGALNGAAAAGDAWPFLRLRRALETARLTRTTPWEALNRLGTELDVTELSELAASASLAGTEGARIRVSLAAKAQSLRTHLLTDTEATAHAATERMSLPWVFLFLGFLLFIGYPAVHQILTAL